MTVMVVDSNPEVRRVINDVVGDLAEVVCECATPLAGLSEYRQVRPDVVVMDIGRPPRDGIWATRQILGLHPEALVVLISAYPDATFRAAAHEAGARGLVLKDNLLDLRQWLEVPHA